jgi:hypothetical protein
MKTLPFAGFKFKVLTSPLLPKSKIYAFMNPLHAKDFIAILQSLNKLIMTNKIRFIVRKPEKKNHQTIIGEII